MVSGGWGAWLLFIWRGEMDEWVKAGARRVWDCIGAKRLDFLHWI